MAVAARLATNLRENVEAVAVGQPYVEQHGLEVGVAHELERFLRGAGRGDGIVLLAKDGFERVADVGFVVDDENVIHRGRE